MNPSRFFIAVCLVALYAASLPADKIKSQVPEPLKGLEEKIAKVLDLEADPETWPVESLYEALRILQDYEKRFSEIEPNERDFYYVDLIGFQMMAIHRTKEVDKVDAMFAEALEYADKLLDKATGSECKKMIQFVREFGFEALKIEFGNEWETVDDVLKIKDIERRERALNSLSWKFIRQEPPNFKEAFRAANAISNSNRQLCYELIAVKQLQMKQADEAEETLLLIDEFWRLKTQLVFVLIYEDQGNIAAAEQHVDTILAAVRKTDPTAVANSFLRCTECLTQLKNVTLAQRMVHGMVDIHEEREKEYQERIAQRPSDPLEMIVGDLADHSRKSVCSQMLAKALLSIGDREAGLRYLQDFRELFTARRTKTRTIAMSKRTWLIGVLFEFGFSDDANKEIADIVAEINAGGQTSTGGRETKSELLRQFARDLLQENQFSECVRIAQSIPDEKERFEVYDQIAGRVAFCSDVPDIRPSLRPRKRFSSPQEILDIAEMLCDEPDGKSLESYRAKIRWNAEKLSKIE